MPTFSRSLEQSLHRALALANERHHEYATLEHLLLALIDDQDAAAVMRACNVDLDKLRGDLTEFLDKDLAGLLGGEPGDLGVHLARSGVRVNVVLYGPIDTHTQRQVFERNPGALEKRLVHWPMGRFGSLDEAAATVAFLASDDAGFITAQAISLDGGITQAFTVPE